MVRVRRKKEEPVATRWFRVTANKFDWSPQRGYVVSYKQGDLGYGTRACIDQGLKIGAIELVDTPEGAKVGKDGSVTVGD